MRGMFTAPAKGTVKICFDNSFSWFTAKKVNHNVTILPFHSQESDEQIVKSDPLLSSPRNDPDADSSPGAGGPISPSGAAAATAEDDNIVG